MKRWTPTAAAADRAAISCGCAAQAVIAVLRGKDENVREAAACALERIGGPEAEGALAEQHIRQEQEKVAGPSLSPFAVPTPPASLTAVSQPRRTIPAADSETAPF